MNHASMPRLRWFAAALALGWGLFFCRVLLDLPWVQAVVLSTIVGAAITIEPKTPRLHVMIALLVGLFMGLGAFWVIGIGRGSLLVGVATAASLFVYLRLSEGPRTTTGV